MAETFPSGDISIRTIAMPADANPSGDIFGGWLLAQMDLAGGTAAQERAGGRVATVGIQAMTFHAPVFVGDELTCYTTLLRVGRTSLTFKVEAWIRRRHEHGNAHEQTKVTEGTFTFVAIGPDRKPRLVPPE